MKYPDYGERANELDSKFNRRLGKYKQLEEKNNINPKLLIDFYQENNIDTFLIDENKLMQNLEDENKKIIDFLERNGPIDNEYKLFDEEEIKILETIQENINEEEKKEENKENNEGEKDLKSEINDEKNNSKEIENDNNDIEKSNLNDKKMTNLEDTKNNEIDRIQQKLEQIKERENTLLEKKSEILRRYLSENVIPLLSKGILNICQNLPEDPVESLAKYLTDNELNKEEGNKNKNLAENEIIKTINESISF